MKACLAMSSQTVPIQNVPCRAKSERAKSKCAVPCQIKTCQVKTCRAVPNQNGPSQSVPCHGKNFRASGSVPCRKHPASSWAAVGSLCAGLVQKSCAQDSCLVRQALSGQDRAQDFCEVKALCGSCAPGAFTA